MPHVLADRVGREVDLVEDLACTAKQLGDDRIQGRVLPVSSDDSVTFAQQVGKRLYRKQRVGRLPGGLHRLGEPGTRLLMVVRHGHKPALEAPNLDRLALTLEEQDAHRLDGRLDVEVVAARVRVLAMLGSTALGVEAVQCPASALSMREVCWSATASMSGA